MSEDKASLEALLNMRGIAEQHAWPGSVPIGGEEWHAHDGLGSHPVSTPHNPSVEPYYLPMDCPVCGRRRMQWDGKVLSCEKCTTSSEWDGFNKDRYQRETLKLYARLVTNAYDVDPTFYNTDPIYHGIVHRIHRGTPRV